MKTRMIEAIESPKDLENLFQENSDEFVRAFPDVFADHPDSIILQVWQERLNFASMDEKQQVATAWSLNNIIFIAILCAITGTLLKFPSFIDIIDGSWFYSRLLAGIFIVPLISYFIHRNRATIKFTTTVFLIAASALIYLSLLPGYGVSAYKFSKQYGAFSDAITNAELYMAIFLWLLLGVAFSGKGWRTTSVRIRFLRYIGEFIIYTTILMLGGIILSLITLALLSFVEKSSELTGWYLENIVIYGIASIPIIATFLLDRIIDKRQNIAPTISKIFTPLFLLTTIAYLIIMVVYQKNPFGDREHLVAVNIFLIIVLGLLLFTISERDPKLLTSTNDYLNIGLVATAILLDVVALSAILYRLTQDSYGLTPNRIATLGINFLVFGHLFGILIYYIRFLWKNKPFEKLEDWVTTYLPYYAIWALIVSIGLPILFWFK
jgi:hypothetical protein